MSETLVFIYCSLIHHKDFQVYKLWVSVQVLNQRKLQVRKTSVEL
jgi:hypothetical protein